MTIVSKASAFPKSVQAGIPRLGRCPEGWTRGPLSRHLVENLRPMKLSDDAEYDLVTVKRSRGGVVRRERLMGRDISVKSQFLLHEGDFLISKRQIVHGACGLVPAELAGSIVSNEYAILGAKPTIDLNFLNHLAHSAYFQQTCFHSSIGVHVEKMIFKLDRWLAWDFDLPPIKEQQRIAEVLSTWDSSIEAVEGLIANARIQKNALMQQLLPNGDHAPQERLTGFSGEWTKTQLGSRGSFRKGKGVSRSDVRAQGIPCVRYGEIYTHHHDVVHTFNSFIDDAAAIQSERLRQGDILFACSGETAEEIGKCVAFTGAHEAYSGGDIVIFSPEHDDPVFLAYMLNSSPVAVQKAQFGQGNSVVHISATNLAKLKISLPLKAEQKAIGALFLAADRGILSLTAQLASLREEKSALIQQLLTGKRRVKVDLEGEPC